MTYEQQEADVKVRHFLKKALTMNRVEYLYDIQKIVNEQAKKVALKNLQVKFGNRIFTFYPQPKGQALEQAKWKVGYDALELAKEQINGKA